MSKNNYLFVLGRNPSLSRAELQPFCTELWFNESKALLIAKNLKFSNPRKLPKTDEQLFLDRLGGTIRMGEILGEYHSSAQLQSAILDHIKSENKFIEKMKLGLSAFGCGKSFLRNLAPSLRDSLEQEQNLKIRLCNSPGENLSSGRIFDERLLQKGYEFMIVQSGNSFLLAKTVANQNIRNYTLRDRIKNFRDAKLGMLPPKLAQILINLANPTYEEMVIDPFCGTGTVNMEAAIMGYKTTGSDIDDEVLMGAQENFNQLAEKFRYPTGNGTFFASPAQKFPKEKLSGVIVTEGYLGHNFEKNPHPSEIERNIQEVLQIWEEVFKNLHLTNIQTVSFCLPAWRKGNEWVSISEKLFAKLEKSPYTPLALFGKRKTYIYSRPGAFVAREICIMKKK